MGAELVAIYAIVAFVCGLVSATIAGNKGLSSGGYFFVGALLSVLGILIAAVAKPEVSDTLRALTPPPGEGWWPDPTGRWDDRYFDGRFWTRHVHRRVDGATFEDPL